MNKRKICFITGTRAEYDLLKPPENTEVKPTIYIVGLTKTDKTTILKEYPKKYIKGKDTPYYPIFTEKNQEKYNQYLDYSKQWKNLILLGRLAEYKYYDMDDIAERALEIFEKEIKNG